MGVKLSSSEKEELILPHLINAQLLQEFKERIMPFVGCWCKAKGR